MIAEYSFLPWLRRGMANQMETPASATSRASLGVTLRVASDVAALDVPPKVVQLIGPGDVTGINPQQVIRTEPRNWITDFEPNYLAFIEFYDEDFAWRFTPALPDTTQHRLAPWITLAVLEETEFDRDTRPGRPATSIRLRAGVSPAAVFPPAAQLYAWSHVHLNASLGTEPSPNLATVEALLRNTPDSGYCRVISPRRLRPDTSYYAFVIPTFEVGRKAALGQTVSDAESGLAISWAVATEFPVLYEWFFRTGKAGDFEELVRALQPRDIDPRVGIRDLDIQQPGFGIGQIVSAPDDVVGLEGAIKAPTTVSKPLAPDSNFPPRIEAEVNRAADAADTGVPGGNDPLVTVPLYGRWHALLDRINTTLGSANWVNELNADPRHRAAAGMGTLVVQKHQEEYMRLAWQQIGEVLEANRKIREAQSGLLTSSAIFTKYVTALPALQALPVLKPIMKKVLGSPVTVHYLVRESRLPLATLSGPMRKQLRPRGLVAQRMLAGSAVRPRDLLAGTVSALNAGTASAAPPRPLPATPTLDSALEGLVRAIPPWLRRVLAWNGILAIVLIALLLVLLIAVPGVLTVVLAAAGVAATIAAYRWSERLRAAVHATDVIAPSGITASAAAEAPPNPSFELLEDGVLPAPATGSGPDSPTARLFRRAATEFNALFEVKAPPAPVRATLDLPAVHSAILSRIEPARTFSERLAPQVMVGLETSVSYVGGTYADAALISPDAERRAFRLSPILGYPDIRKPMYAPLRDVSPDLLVPNLHLIPPNTISLMVTNQKFIEAYLVGVNHEFARELLWREYPTDQRGSSFRQFWDPSRYVNRKKLPRKQFEESIRDITKLHEWRRTEPLGVHNNRDAQGDTAQLILVIRGDLLKRYPNTIIYAQAARWGTQPEHQFNLSLYDETGEKLDSNPADSNISFPIFGAEVAPDLHFVGFDLTLKQVKGHANLAETPEAKASIPEHELGWFFVLQEVVGEPRFGMDEKRPAVPSQSNMWDNLSWENLAADVKVIDFGAPFAPPTPGASNGLAWGANAADMASILYQKPVLVAVHAREMLKNLKL